MPALELVAWRKARPRVRDFGPKPEISRFTDGVKVMNVFFPGIISVNSVNFPVIGDLLPLSRSVAIASLGTGKFCGLFRTPLHFEGTEKCYDMILDLHVLAVYDLHYVNCVIWVLGFGLVA